MTFGERLIMLRESRSIERKELAEALGIPYTTLRNYETDAREPGHIFLIKLTQIFNVTVDYLLGLSDKPDGYKTVDTFMYGKDSLEVAEAYEKAEITTKNHVRLLLELPKLEPDIIDMECGEELETS